MILALLFFFAQAHTIRYWVAACDGPETGCRTPDVELARWGFEAWARESGGLLKVERSSSERAAQIRLYWAGARQGLYGEARPIVVDGKPGAEVYVRPAGAEQDGLLRDTIVYLTCVHETGHALGLSHTADFADIMYSFQFGGDIPEYFGRYRRLLKTRDDIRSHSGISGHDLQRLVETLR